MGISIMILLSSLSLTASSLRFQICMYFVYSTIILLAKYICVISSSTIYINIAHIVIIKLTDMASQYKCPKERVAQFCCAQPACDQVAIKCVGSNECDSCRKNHNKCPRQIRIDKVVDKAKQRKESLAPKDQQYNQANLIDKLIKQLQEVKLKYNKIDNKRWGLEKSLSELIYDEKVKQKKGSDVANLLNEQIVFPDKRYYCPPQFKKDAERVQAINKQFESRMIALHKVYQALAECSCSLKRNQKNPKYDSLELLHKKFGKATFERLQIKPMFEGVKNQTSSEEIKNFKDLGMKLLIITCLLIQILKDKSNFKQALILIQMAFELFNENRKQYRLQDNDNFGSENIGKIRQKLLEYEGIFLYETEDYKKAYEYYSKLSQDKKTSNVLEKLRKMCKKLEKQSQILPYLLKLETYKAEDVQLLQDIISCYQKLKDRDNLYHYYKKVNQIEGADRKKWNQKKIKTRLQRYKWLVDYEQKSEKLTAVLNSILDALKIIEQQKFNYDIFKLSIELRYRMALIHRFNYFTESSAADIGVNICDKVLFKLNNDRQQQMSNQKKISYQEQCSNKIDYDKKIYFVKEYMVKFMLIVIKVRKNHPSRSIYLEKAVKICQQLQLKLFEPYYLRALNTFQIGNRTAKQCQIKALQIYPTHICYANLATLLYESYFKTRNQYQLIQCIDSIRRSLLLKPDQTPLYHLRALAYQNLGQYRQSNGDFEKIINKLNGNRKPDAQRRMAQNYLFILKTQSSQLTQDDKIQILIKAKRLYENCLDVYGEQKRCLLGYGRVLKLMKRFAEAETHLKKLLQFNSELKLEAYMELGNIKQQLGKMNDERDFDLLEEALKMYKMAGTSNQNKENLKRIYFQLDEPKKYEQFLKKLQRPDQGQARQP